MTEHNITTIKEKILKKPHLKRTNDLWQNHHETLRQDKNFTKQAILTAMPFKLSYQIWQNSTELHHDLEYIKTLILTEPHSQLSIELFNQYHSYLETDLNFVKQFTLRKPNHPFSQKHLEKHSEEFTQDLDFVMSMIKQAPQSFFVQNLWKQNKSELINIFIKNLDTVKDIILAKPNSVIARDLWVEFKDHLISDNRFTTKILEKKAGSDLAHELWSEYRVTLSNNPAFINKLATHKKVKLSFCEDIKHSITEDNLKTICAKVPDDSAECFQVICGDILDTNDDF